MADYMFSPRQKKGFFGSMSVTMILVLVNVVTFIIFTILISTNVLSIDAIALKPQNILAGKDLWTFLTSMFMHASFLHIFVNMLSLVFIGTFVERIIGRKRYFWFYMISGLVAGLFFVFASLILHSDFTAYAVGASGAIFGIAGLMVILTPNVPLYVMFIPIPIKAKYAIPGLLAILWIISVAGNIGIGNTAHLGGLLSGIVYGIYLKKKYKKKTRYISKYFS